MNNQSSYDDIDYDLLGRYFAGEASAAEKEKVLAWAREHTSVFEELRMVWLDTGKIDNNPVDIDTDAAWKKVQSRIQPAEKSQKKQPLGYTNILKIAAALVILVGLGWIIQNIVSQANNDQTLALESVVVYASDTLSTKLPDQSVVKLNSGSTIKYSKDFEGKSRQVKLVGEAFFDVKRDEKRPFIVNVDGAQITVLGTSFTVTALEGSDSVLVFVTSGTVSLSVGNKKLILTKDMKGVLVKSKNQLQTKEPDPLEAFWINHEISFKNASIREVAEVLGVVYSTKIDVHISDDSACKLTVQFDKNTSLPMALDIIKSTLGIEVSKDDSKYMLTGEGCR